MDDHLDIPEFLRRQDQASRANDEVGPTKPARCRSKRRPANWFMLTKAEQDGTADATTIALRKQCERDKKDKQAARFARLRELAAERKRR
jgi:hypothetical protein